MACGAAISPRMKPSSFPSPRKPACREWIWMVVKFAKVPPMRFRNTSRGNGNGLPREVRLPSKRYRAPAEHRWSSAKTAAPLA